MNPGAELAQLLLGLDQQERERIIGGLFDPNHESAELNGAVAKALVPGAVHAEECARAMLTEHCLRYSLRDENYQFSAAHDGPKIITAGQLLRKIAECSTKDAWVELQAVAPVLEVQREMLPLSPLRYRPNADASDTVWGEFVLLDMLASGFGANDEFLGVPDESMRRAEEYLGKRSWIRSKEIRDCIQRMLNHDREKGSEEPPNDGS